MNGLRIVGGPGVTRIIFPKAPTFLERKDRERHSFGVVYANDIALEAMNAKPRSFKPGAVIVREKLSQPDSKTPELLAVMIKREPGFNAPTHDWEFLVLDGTATRIRKREKKGTCFGCHKTQQDFVYGDYERK